MSSKSKKRFRGESDKVARCLKAMHVQNDEGSEPLAEYLETVDSERQERRDFCDDDLTPAEELAAGCQHMKKFFG